MGKKDKKKKNQQLAQQEVSSSGGDKSAIVNGISTEKQNVSAVENLNTANEKANEQTILEARTQKNNSNDKKVNKKEKTKSKGPIVTKEPKKTSFFSIKKLIFIYILAVFFWCNGKTQKQCNSYEEAFCFNGVSQYILNNDFFHKYIEPAITKTKLNVYGKQALDTISINYETHAKPYFNPLLESAQPHLQTVRELSVEYVYNPVAEGLIKAQDYYNDNAKEHVDNYYNQVVKFSVPYFSQAQEHVSYAYEQTSKYNKNTVQPWYHKSVVPLNDKVIFYYNTKIVPFAYRILEFIKQFYYEKIVPIYHNHIEPHILTILESFRSKTEKETKADTERKAKEESNKRAKAEAERKAKEEADKKAKAEAERKAKEEADRKAKAEAERKAKEAANKAVRNAFNKEFPLVKENLTLALDDYERKATFIAQEILREVEDRIATLKKSGSEYLVNLKEFVERIRKDSAKDRNTKFNEIKDLAKKFIGNIKESSQKFTEISKKSYDDLEEKKFDELKKEFSINLVTRIFATQKSVYDKADNIEVDDKLKTDIEMTTNDIIRELNENKNNASLRVREIFKIIIDKIELLSSTKDDIIAEILSYVKTEKEILKSEANENVSEKNEKDDAKIVGHKDDNQIPVQVEEKPTAEEKASDVTVQTSSDLVLEKLKARQDPVLDTLKKGYELFKGNEPTVQVQSADEEDEDEDDEYESDESCS